MNKTKTTIEKTEFLTRVGILTAIATVMYLFMPEIPLFTEHLKFDISDLPAMLAALTTGPAAGMAVLVLKNVFHLFKSTTYGIGEVINVVVGGTMIFTLLGSRAFITKLRKKSKDDHASYFIASVITAAATVAVGFLLNLALTPVYFMLIGLEYNAAMVWGNAVMSLGLNVVKSVANTLLVYPIFLAVRSAVKSSAGKSAKI